MRRLLMLTAAIGLVTLSAAPAGATHGGIHPTFRTEQVYFHCNGPTKVYQVNWAAALGSASSFVPWNTTAPSQSVQQGAGCGSLDSGHLSTAFWDPVFQGTFHGNLRDFTLKLHNLILSQARPTTTLNVRISVFVDDEPVISGQTVTVTPTRSSTGASELVEISITNLGFARDVLDAEGNVIGVETGGLATEDGDGTLERTIRILVDTPEIGRAHV